MLATIAVEDKEKSGSEKDTVKELDDHEVQAITKDLAKSLPSH